MRVQEWSLADASHRTAFGDKLGRWATTIAVLAVVLLSWGATPASAQDNYHTWYASTGRDFVGCGNYDAPCLNAYYSIGQTRAGGIVQCKDAMIGIATSITKSLTFICESVPGTNIRTDSYAVLTITVGPSDTVVLRGLNLHTIPSFFLGPAITFDGSGTLILDNLKVTGWGNGGVLFKPNGPAKLEISNSHFEVNGDVSGNAGAAIRIVPQSAGSARVRLDHVTAVGNVFGIAVDGTSSTVGINTTISESELSGNKNDGLIAVTSSGHAPIGVLATNTRSVNNAYGFRSIGPNVTVRVKNSEVVGNGIGLVASGGGALLSMGQNAIQANGTNGAFTGIIALE